MKQEIKSAPILAYYSPKKQIVLQTDVSIKGLGAVFYKKKNQYILQAKHS